VGRVQIRASNEVVDITRHLGKIKAVEELHASVGREGGSVCRCDLYPLPRGGSYVERDGVDALGGDAQDVVHPVIVCVWISTLQKEKGTGGAPRLVTLVKKDEVDRTCLG
jgi:hypothetical protein